MKKTVIKKYKGLKIVLIGYNIIWMGSVGRRGKW